MAGEILLNRRQMGSMEAIEVSRDLSGGVRVKFGPAGFVLSPQDAIRYGTAILKAAGCNVDFTSVPVMKATP
jgi:hypothetical protein